jgi:hypothetical protein
MTKASASRNTENLRGVEAVVSVDRFSKSEGAEGSDFLTVALRLVGSGADDTPPSAPRNSKLCQLWVLAEKSDLTGRAAFGAALDGICICSHAPAAGEKPDLLANSSASARGRRTRAN